MLKSAICSHLLLKNAIAEDAIRSHFSQMGVVHLTVRWVGLIDLEVKQTQLVEDDELEV